MDSIEVRNNDFMRGYDSNMRPKNRSQNSEYHNVGQMNYYGYPFGPGPWSDLSPQSRTLKSFEEVTSSYEHKKGYGDWGPLQTFYSAKTGVYGNPINPTYVYPIQNTGKCVYDKDIPKGVVKRDLSRFYY